MGLVVGELLEVHTKVVGDWTHTHHDQKCIVQLAVRRHLAKFTVGAVARSRYATFPLRTVIIVMRRTGRLLP